MDLEKQPQRYYMNVVITLKEGRDMRCANLFKENMFRINDLILAKMDMLGYEKTNDLTFGSIMQFSDNEKIRCLFNKKNYAFKCVLNECAKSQEHIDIGGEIYPNTKLVNLFLQ